MGIEVSELVSSRVGLAYYCSKDEHVELDIFETSEVVGGSTLHSVNLHVYFSCLRRNLLFNHMLYAEKGGLQYVIPMQLCEGSMVLV